MFLSWEASLHYRAGPQLVDRGNSFSKGSGWIHSSELIVRPGPTSSCYLASSTWLQKGYRWKLKQSVYQGDVRTVTVRTCLGAMFSNKIPNKLLLMNSSEHINVTHSRAYTFVSVWPLHMGRSSTRSSERGRSRLNPSRVNAITSTSK